MDNNNDKQFEWTDDLVKEYSANLVLSVLKIIDKLQNGGNENINHQSLGKFKESKLKGKVVEQPIAFIFETATPISDELHNKVIDAIKQTLNPTPPYNSIEEDRGMTNHIEAQNKFFTSEIKRHEESIEKLKQEKECDYEILSFISTTNNICKIRDNGKYSYESNGDTGIWSAECMMATHPFKIHSVLRKKDSTVLSIDSVTDKGKITSFVIKNNRLVVYFEHGARECFFELLKLVTPKTEPQLDTKPLLTLKEVEDAITNFDNWNKSPAGNHVNVNIVLDKLRELAKQKSTPTKQ